MKTAIFPGSFDPFTIGHADVVDRILPLFDKVVIAFGVNTQKTPYFPLEERMEAVRRRYAGDSRVEVVGYTDLTADLAARYGAKYVVRGVRSVADFEYERTIADANRMIAGLETVFIIADPHVAHISSSLVRELKTFGRDVSEFLPK